MVDAIVDNIPADYEKIRKATEELDFTMASDLQTGSLLKTLASSKPGGSFLELGTGTGLATTWILSGMDENSSLVTVDNNELLIDVARKYITDNKVQFELADGYEWIRDHQHSRFDFIFADAMPGKYELFEETIGMLKQNGFYIIDDMLPQSNWPAGHEEKVAELISKIEKRNDLVLTKLNWSTGIIIVVKK